MTIATKMPETLEDVVDSELEDVESVVEVELDDTASDDPEEDGDDLDDDDEIDTETATAEPTNTGDPIIPPVNAINAEEHFRQRVEAAEREVLDTTLAEMRAEEAHKEAKAEAKAAREVLQKIMDRGPEQLPLFDDAEKSASGANKQSPVAEAAADEQPAVGVEADDESWREVEIGELKIPDGIVKALLSAEIETVGDLANYTAADKRLTDIAGIGQAKVEKIDAAMLKFFAARKAGE